MSPIVGYTDVRRLPRIGAIHLGVKEQDQAGAAYPKAVGWFEVHEDSRTSAEAAQAFHAVYGERPTELHIMFPSDDDLLVADANYKAYSQTHGLVCKGTGETAVARWDAEGDGPRPHGAPAGTWAHRGTREWVMREIPCLAAACPMMQAGRCRPVMNLQFLLPRVAGVGVWQIDTGSWHSIVNVRANIELLKAATGGRIRGIELLLRRVPWKVTPAAGSAKTVWVLDIYNPLSLPELLSRTARPESAGGLLLPPVDDEMPEDLYPDVWDGEAAGPGAGGASSWTGAPPAPPARLEKQPTNAERLRAYQRTRGLSLEEVCDRLGIEHGQEPATAIKRALAAQMAQRGCTAEDVYGDWLELLEDAPPAGGEEVDL